MHFYLNSTSTIFQGIWNFLVHFILVPKSFQAKCASVVYLKPVQYHAQYNHHEKMSPTMASLIYLYHLSLVHRGVLSLPVLSRHFFKFQSTSGKTTDWGGGGFCVLWARGCFYTRTQSHIWKLVNLFVFLQYWAWINYIWYIFMSDFQWTIPHLHKFDRPYYGFIF